MSVKKPWLHPAMDKEAANGTIARTMIQTLAKIGCCVTVLALQLQTRMLLEPLPSFLARN